MLNRIAAIAIVGALIWIATRPSQPETPASTRSPAKHQMTDAEAEQIWQSFKRGFAKGLSGE